jgi:alpha-beta hydrolase superfamily lysophospholipase
MRRIFIILFAIFLTSGCVQQTLYNQTTYNQTTNVTESIEVAFRTEDGFVIYGDYYESSDQTYFDQALILLHMLNNDRKSYSEFAQQLKEQGFTVLAIDLRGHGESTSQNNVRKTWQQFSEDDFRAMTNDVKAAKLFLQSKGKTTAIIGASIGANVALNYAVTDKDIKALVLLSPGLNYRGVITEETIKSYENPILLFAAEGDVDSADAVKYMYFFAQGKKQLLVLNGTNIHGTEMLPQISNNVININMFLSILM